MRRKEDRVPNGPLSRVPSGKLGVESIHLSYRIDSKEVKSALRFPSAILFEVKHECIYVCSRFRPARCKVSLLT